MKPHVSLLILLLAPASALLLQAEPWVTYPPRNGPGNGRHIVLLSGDEEYRSEESLPMLARILSERHGFKCTVLFSQDANGTINPNNQTNVPGMHLLGSADLVINAFRFRELPDADMKPFVDYFESGKPMIIVRTATHAFHYTRNPRSPYARYGFAAPDGGFGGMTSGETWTYHHGDHGKEATRGVINGRNRKHPMLKGVVDIFGPTDVYGVNADFPEDATVLLWGLTLAGMKPEDPLNWRKASMPIVWLREVRVPSGRSARILSSTIGAAIDLESPDLRRLFINACFDLTGLPVPDAADVSPVEDYHPSMFGFDRYRRDVKVADFERR